MSKPSPTMDPLNPQPGDILLWERWRIVVLYREPNYVFYTATRGPETKREAKQTLEEWRTWAPHAKVEQPDTKCTVTMYASGPCQMCMKNVGSEAHLFNGKMFCAACCNAVHGKPKKRREAVV